jgi:glycosyltransferase involved in cell wall biosynthesis
MMAAAGRPEGGAPAGERLRVAVLLPHLEVGGAELSMLRIARGLAEQHGLAVDLLTPRPHGGLAGTLGPSVALVALGGGATLRAMPGLVRYLARHRPDVLMSGQPHLNIVAAAACAATGGRTALVVIEHAPLAHEIACYGGWRYRILHRLVPPAYRRARAVVAISQGVAEGLQRIVPGLAPELIPNPVLPDDLERLRVAPPSHPWLEDGGPPVIASTGRLAVEKDFPTLVRAFAMVARRRPVRLLILGEGPERGRILATAAAEGVADRVSLPGRAGNVFAPVSRCAAFALASRFEGFGNVLVEALACGVPVVGTDCPVGPREILAGGRFGRLVPPGDAAAMADALLVALEERGPRPGLDAHLEPFTVRASVLRYLELVERLASRQAAARPLAEPSLRPS